MPIHQTQRAFYKQMFRLALPIALQNLLTSSAQLVDTAMVVGLGNSATAAVGVAIRWSFLLNIGLFGISSGCATLASQAWGAKDDSSIQRSYGIGLLLSALLGLLYTLGCVCMPQAMIRVFTSEAPVIEQGAVYLSTVGWYGVFVAFSMISATLMRATGNVVTPLLCAVVSVLTNSVLNYGLIYGKLGLPNLGLRGAALATVTAAAVQALLLFLIGKLKKEHIFSSLRGIFAFTRPFLAQFFRIMTPTLGNELSWAIGTNIYMMVFARQGSENFAAYTIFSSVEQLSFIFFIGICHACAIMVGKTIGEGELESAYTQAKRFVRMMPLVGIAMGLLMVALRYPVSGLLPIETDFVRENVAKLLLVYACFLPFRPVPYICIVGIFRAGGDTKTGMFIDSFCLYCMSIPAVLILGFAVHVPFWLLIAAMYFFEDCIKIILCLRHFKLRRWIRRLNFPEPISAE